ncbi:hypothetical protein [Pantoea ananatis]|uniref:hypothetical protein n=1 Tax=Pantoea ananas TaxID=553 RepID=UPI0021E8F570|nr:hypothetical protein [Pantoea ananatis]MCW0309896.1 hypothetical protein [Pantoea ananatis]MCW0341622.1 hypothetical protein [Pantoea ananatis]MCW0360122.1 hypothetical protein [Pantoea ananatis]MCW0364717.1 hypothetical protein [Pantoea ananatis]MCW1777369.1 hypothetical protein [Pantoea ananatis]
MSTEHSFSDVACLQSAENQEYNYVHLYTLACMEGDLLVMRAEQRITGSLDNDLLAWMSNLAWDYSMSGYTSPEYFSCSVAKLAVAVEQLALEVFSSEWSYFIKVCEEEKEVDRLIAEEEGLAQMRVSDHTENDTEYKSLPWRGDSTDGIVYLPVIKPTQCNFEVGSLDHERIVAVVPKWSDAVDIAHYSASDKGGFGDVIVRSTDQNTTHSDFKAWLLD